MERYFIDFINITIVPDLNKVLAEWTNNWSKTAF